GVCVCARLNENLFESASCEKRKQQLEIDFAIKSLKDKGMLNLIRLIKFCLVFPKQCTLSLSLFLASLSLSLSLSLSVGQGLYLIKETIIIGQRRMRNKLL